MKMLLPIPIGLILLLASTCSAAPTDSKENAVNKRETPCIANGHCPGMDSPPPPPPPSITPPPAASVSPTSPPVAVKSAIDSYLYGCLDDQKAKVKEAWTEAAMLAKAHAQWKPPGWFSSGAYQPAQAMYLGDNSKNDNPWFGTGPLKKNIIRQQAIHEDAPLFTYGYFYCNEDNLPTKKKKSEPECGVATTAWTFDDPGTIWSAHYLVFCPTFWGNRMASLAQRVQEGTDNSDLQGFMDPWWSARARSLFHETYHWGTTVSQPKCDLRPEKYTPKDVVDLARKGNTGKAKMNAESWAQAAMAMYLQQTVNLKSPLVPQPEDKNSQSGLMSADNGPLEESFSDEMPDWFAPPVVQGAPKFEPDMANAVQLSSI